MGSADGGADELQQGTCPRRRSLRAEDGLHGGDARTLRVERRRRELGEDRRGNQERRGGPEPRSGREPPDALRRHGGASLQEHGRRRQRAPAQDRAPYTDFQALAVDGDVVYAGTGYEGVFKSTDGGATWKESGEGLGAAFVWGLAADPASPGVVYFTTGLGLLKSDAAGKWTPMKFGDGRIPDKLEVFVDERRPGLFYLAAYTHGLLRSSDGGKSWLKPPEEDDRDHTRPRPVEPERRLRRPRNVRLEGRRLEEHRRRRRSRSRRAASRKPTSRASPSTRGTRPPFTPPRRKKASGRARTRARRGPRRRGPSARRSSRPLRSTPEAASGSGHAARGRS